jgi:hypothetical protein
MIHFFSEQGNPYGQMFYRGTLFKPYKEDTEDYNEWNDIFAEEEVDFTEIYEVCQEKRTRFYKNFRQ